MNPWTIEYTMNETQELYRVPIDRETIEFDRSENKFYLNLDEDSLLSLYFELKEMYHYA